MPLHTHKNQTQFTEHRWDGFFCFQKNRHSCKHTHTHTHTLQCSTTDQFLKTKLFNLRQALWQKHGANGAQLDAAEKYLVGGDDDADGGASSSLVKYACELHGQSPQAIRTKAALFVRFGGVPEEQHDAAVTLVIQYMDMFIAVVHPGCE
jgi:hypothetical protein